VSESKTDNSPRVYRGGVWYFSEPSRVRAAARDTFVPAYRGHNLGFRCAGGGFGRKSGRNTGMKIELALYSTREQPKTAAQWASARSPHYHWESASLITSPDTIWGFMDEVMSVDADARGDTVAVRSTWGDREWTQYVHPTYGVVPKLFADADGKVIEEWPTLEELGGPWVATHVLPDGHGMPLCYVPPAEGFQMGDAKSSTEDRRIVEVPGGFVALTPTTIEQWAWYCAATEKPVPGVNTENRHHPVVGVDFWQSRAFAEWAGLELPTEEQWERAARGDDGRKFPWGNEEPGAYPDPKCHWSGGDGEGAGGVAPVFERPDGASPYGCLDMSGNVWERCESLYYRSSR